MKVRFVLSMLALACAAVASTGAHAAGTAPLPVLAPACDRACLYGIVDRYLDALPRHDARALPWARKARYSENNVELAPGDGLWNTATKVEDYRLKFADVRGGQVGVFGVVQESGDRSEFALRLKVVDNTIVEAETLVVRIAEFGTLNGGINPFANVQMHERDRILMQQPLAPGEGRPRERMISVANGYFDTLQQNDGTLFTQFDPQCTRYENGVLTTNNPAQVLGPLTAKGCEQQFRLGGYRYDDRVRDRRFPLVDEEHGLVLATGFIDHSGRIGDFKLTDGTPDKSPIRHPHSFCLMELFKVVNGRLRQVEAVFITVPYNMPSPWVERP